MAAPRQPSLWLVIAITALLAAAVTLGLDRAVSAFRAAPPVPTPTVGAAQRYVVVIETPEVALEPSIVPDDELSAQLQALQQRQTRYEGFMFVQKAERQLAFAGEALQVNDAPRTDRELEAARASLDQALRLLPEDLKPQIQNERLLIGQIRADVEINPRGLDQALRRMRDRLLTVIALPEQP